LAPLGWLAAILVSALISTFLVHAPPWAPICIGILLAMCVAGYFGAYGYFMFKDPDALRSQRVRASIKRGGSPRIDRPRTPTAGFGSGRGVAEG
jgi:hypothetical protein